MQQALPQQIDVPVDPALQQQWDADFAKRALDELFLSASRYRTSSSYRELMSFVSQFRLYSPYNAMLAHIQMPGARFVATASRWLEEYGRIVKPGARPIVILRPMGPVMFVFDISDTKPAVLNKPITVTPPGKKPKKIRPVPIDAENPFGVRRGNIGNELNRTIENAKRDGIRTSYRKEGSSSAGSICPVDGSKQPPLEFDTGRNKKGQPTYKRIKVRYDLLIRKALDPPARYATLVHELAHLYCGHLGSPNPKWWPDRRHLNHAVREFEAESVSYLLCRRKGIDSPAGEYLGGCLDKNEDPPTISIECVMKTAGLIEQMGQGRMKPRKE